MEKSVEAMGTNEIVEALRTCGACKGCRERPLRDMSSKACINLLIVAADRIEQLAASQTQEKAAAGCDGCKEKGKWENEVEYGYPSPCTLCKRRCTDNWSGPEAEKGGTE